MTHPGFLFQDASSGAPQTLPKHLSRASSSIHIAQINIPEGWEHRGPVSEEPPSQLERQDVQASGSYLALQGRKQEGDLVGAGDGGLGG